MIPVGILATQEQITLVSLTIDPTSGSTFNLNNGGTRQVSVYANWSDGTQTNVTSEATYHSTFEARATVSSTGLVTASSSNTGGATININYGGLSGWVNVNVVAVVTGISVTPTSVSLPSGRTQQLTVTAHLSSGANQNVTSSASYSSTNNNRATVSNSGLITAGNQTGAVTINLSYQGFGRSVSVTTTAAVVDSLSRSPTSITLPSGRTQQITVTANMSNGSTQNVTASASYTSNQTSRATVSSSGLVTAGNTTGAYTISISYGGSNTSVSGTTTAAVVDSISVTPTSVSLPMGRTQQLTVTAHMSNGSTQTVTGSASYSSNQTSRATVSSGGLITAGNTTGAATITITYSGASTTMTSTTTAAVVDSLSISPTSFSLAQGLTRQMAVTAHMSNGTNQTVTSSASYSSNQTSRATVNSTGLVTASNSNTGAVNITATYGGQSAVSNGTITAAVVNSISVSPSSFSVEVGSTQQLTVTAAMSNGTNQNVTSSASYTRTNSNITVSSSGLVTGVSAGSSGVNITYDGKSTSSSITVTQAVKTIVDLRVVEIGGGLPMIEIYLTQSKLSQSFYIEALYNDSTTRVLETYEWSIMDPGDFYIKYDTFQITPRFYVENWNLPSDGYNITVSINYIGSEPTNVETKPLTIRYNDF